MYSTIKRTFQSHVVTDRADAEAAYRPRYEVYIVEQGNPYPQADHKQRHLTDELDHNASIILVTADGEPCGTVRANWFDDGTTDRLYHGVCELARFSQIPRREMSVCSRLAVLPNFRYSKAAVLPFESIYIVGIGKGTKLCFVTCAPFLRRLFRKYGFREFASPIEDPAVGRLHRTVLVLDDVDHLAGVGSPLAAAAQALNVVPNSRPWLSKIFHEFEAQEAERLDVAETPTAPDSSSARPGLRN